MAKVTLDLTAAELKGLMALAISNEETISATAKRLVAEQLKEKKKPKQHVNKYAHFSKVDAEKNPTNGNKTVKECNPNRTPRTPILTWLKALVGLHEPESPPEPIEKPPEAPVRAPKLKHKPKRPKRRKRRK